MGKVSGFGRGMLFAAAALGGLCSATLAQAAQPVVNPPYVVLPNILYVIPYAVATHPAQSAAVFPDAETVVTIGGVKKGCLVQLEWIDWDGTVVGLSGPTPAAAMVPGGSLQYHTRNSVGGLIPYILNVNSNLSGPFEGRAVIRSDCPANLKLQVDAGFEVLQSANTVPLYKRIPVVRPAGNTGG